MGRITIIPLPTLRRRMTAFGENLRLARLRRKLRAVQVAERAGITRQTLSSVEHGDPAVSFGVYANVLFVLGLDSDLDILARDDELGRKLQDADLAVGRRAPRKTKNPSTESVTPGKDLA